MSLSEFILCLTIGLVMVVVGVLGEIKGWGKSSTGG